jgi:hypothetical protein
MRAVKHITLAILALFALGTPAAFAQEESIIGQWAGLVLQNEPSETYPVTLTINADGSGRIDYPMLGCGGDLTRERRNGDVIYFRERITYGDHCITNGTVGVYPRGRRLIWFWTGEGSSFPGMSASAVLTRDVPIS